jgi:glutamate-1-semialdehyde aminotransferase
MLVEFLTELQLCGVRPTSRGLWFVSAAHTDDVIDRTLAAATEALRRLEARRR